jgi:hypothetical protein
MALETSNSRVSAIAVGRPRAAAMRKEAIEASIPSHRIERVFDSQPALPAATYIVRRWPGTLLQ